MPAPPSILYQQNIDSNIDKYMWMDRRSTDHSPQLLSNYITHDLRFSLSFTSLLSEDDDRSL